MLCPLPRSLTPIINICIPHLRSTLGEAQCLPRRSPRLPKTTDTITTVRIPIPIRSRSRIRIRSRICIRIRIHTLDPTFILNKALIPPTLLLLCSEKKYHPRSMDGQERRRPAGRTSLRLAPT